MRKLQRRDWYLLGGLTGLAALLRFVNLPHPGEIIFDETYFANFAHNYLTNTKFFDAEPPLGKFLIAGGEWLFGHNSFGWRLVPALFGTAVIPLMYLLAKRIFGGTVLPFLAAALALLDGLLLVESRTAVLDGFVVFFNLLTYLLFFCSLQASSRTRSALWLGATGVSLGLGLSLKWITLAFLGPAVALLLLLAWSSAKPVRKFFKVRSAKALFDAVGAKAQNLLPWYAYVGLLGIVPALVYIPIFLAHLPFDSTGQGFIQLHQTIFNYHHTLKAVHPYGSDWYTWPLEIRPVAYYFKTIGGQWQGIVALGNPVIWWSGAAAVVFGVWRFLFRPRGGRPRDLALGFLLFAVLAHYGPWSVIGRVLFLYHYLGALPFVILILAYTLRQSWDWKPSDKSLQLFIWILLLAAAITLGGMLGRSVLGTLPASVSYGVGGVLAGLPVLWLAGTNHLDWRWGRKQTVAFMGICALAFVYFYPIWTGVGLDTADYLRHMWLKSWI